MVHEQKNKPCKPSFGDLVGPHAVEHDKDDPILIETQQPTAEETQG